MQSFSKAGRLASLIEKIEWTQIQVHTINSGVLKPNNIVVEFGQKKKEDPTINDIRVRLGREVMSKLGWKHADRLIALFNPNDQLTFLIAKSDHGHGHKLTKVTGNPTAGGISFRWEGDVPLRKMKATPVEFEAYEGKLVFVVTAKDME